MSDWFDWMERKLGVSMLKQQDYVLGTVVGLVPVSFRG